MFQNCDDLAPKLDVFFHSNPVGLMTVTDNPKKENYDKLVTVAGCYYYGVYSKRNFQRFLEIMLELVDSPILDTQMVSPMCVCEVVLLRCFLWITVPENPQKQCCEKLETMACYCHDMYSRRIFTILWKHELLEVPNRRTRKKEQSENIQSKTASRHTD